MGYNALAEVVSPCGALRFSGFSFFCLLRCCWRSNRPGEYQVYAWQDIDSYAFLDPDFMRGYEDRGQDLKAEASGRYTLVLPALDAQPPEP